MSPEAWIVVIVLSGWVAVAVNWLWVTLVDEWHTSTVRRHQALLRLVR